MADLSPEQREEARNLAGQMSLSEAHALEIAARFVKLEQMLGGVWQIRTLLMRHPRNRAAQTLLHLITELRNPPIAASAATDLTEDADIERILAGCTRPESRRR